MTEKIFFIVGNYLTHIHGDMIVVGVVVFTRVLIGTVRLVRPVHPSRIHTTLLSYDEN